ncbi:biotin-dependent carboxyltransferase family protein [Herbiconiux sp. 11R-BC]|uniref:5-oxoprolinase subunit C family protein n=1 Tax=Herbiconiux sp. 11R-BC TaxID=3111637 RepID=UPI003C0B8379
MSEDGRAALEVLATGPLALLQDLGRPGFAHLGVTASGAADRGAFTAANRLVGNPAHAAAIETVFGGLEVRALRAMLVAVTGAAASVFHVRPGRAPVEQPSGCSLALLAGDRVLLGPPTTGLRNYLAVRGGIGVDAVLGSRSTDILSGLGPRPLVPGARLPLADEPDSARASGARLLLPHDPEAAGDHPTMAGWPEATVIPPALPGEGPAVLQVTRGPRDDWFGASGWSTLLATTWTVGADSNRVGIRLETATTATTSTAAISWLDDARELPSEGMVAGAVQVPPSGQPVVFHRDHPVTGGYPVIGVLTEAAVDRAAQLRPGDMMRFRELFG